MIDKKKLKLDILVKRKQSSAEINNIIERLKKIDLNTNLDDGTALNYAVNYDKMEIIKFLLENGADVNSTQKNGFTPLMSAIESEDVNLVKLLLSHNADVNKRHKKGADALFKAIHCQNLEIIEALLQSGANPYLEFKNYTNYQAVIDMGRDKRILELFKKYYDERYQ